MSFIKENGLIEFKSAEMRFTGNGNKNSGISTATYPYFNGFNRQNFNPLSTIPLLRNLTSIRLTVL